MTTGLERRIIATETRKIDVKEIHRLLTQVLKEELAKSYDPLNLFMMENAIIDQETKGFVRAIGTMRDVIYDMYEDLGVDV